jgi:hypothetical protein
MHARLHHLETASAVSPSPADRFAFAILKDGVWTVVAFYPTAAAAWADHLIGIFDDALNAAYPFDRVDVIPIAPDLPTPDGISASDLTIDLDIPDGDYRGVNLLAVFAANAERKAIEDSRFDARSDRLRQAWEGD